MKLQLQVSNKANVTQLNLSPFRIIVILAGEGKRGQRRRVRGSEEHQGGGGSHRELWRPPH